MTRSTMTRRAMVLIAACIASSAGAQDAPPSGWARAHDASSVTNGTRVGWLGAWSPLRPIADIARGEVRAPFGPGLLDAPSPMMGAFIVAGAPGAIVRDLTPRLRGDTARFGEVRVQRAGESGSFHRPLDVVQGTATQVAGMGWSPVGARGIAMGRFVVDQESEDTSSFTQRISPAWSSPFIATDSVRPPMTRTRARVEGALGLRLGAYGLGLSAAVDSREHNSGAFPLRRTGRWATPAVMAGVERTLPWFNARIGTYARWSEASETNVLNPSPLNTVIYAMKGYDEPPGIPVVNATLFVRNDRRATALGGTFAFEVASTHVVVVHEQGDRADDQYRLITARVRPTDSWRTTARESRIQVARLFGESVRAMLVAYDVSLDGRGTRDDLAGLAVDGSDGQQAVEADVRYTRGAWRVGALGGLTRRTHDRRDFVAELSATIEQSTPFVSAEVARTLGGTWLGAGVSSAWTSPTAALPPAARGVNYQRLIAPELAYDAAEATAMAYWVNVRRAVRGHDVFAQLRLEQASPTTVAVARLQPGGERSRWQVSVGYRP